MHVQIHTHMCTRIVFIYVYICVYIYLYICTESDSGSWYCSKLLNLCIQDDVYVYHVCV